MIFDVTGVVLAHAQFKSGQRIFNLREGSNEWSLLAPSVGPMPAVGETVRVVGSISVGKFGNTYMPALIEPAELDLDPALERAIGGRAGRSSA